MICPHCKKEINASQAASELAASSWVNGPSEARRRASRENGRKSGGRKAALTPEQVAAVRASKATARTLARQYQVSLSVIRRAVQRKH